MLPTYAFPFFSQAGAITCRIVFYPETSIIYPEIRLVYRVSIIIDGVIVFLHYVIYPSHDLSQPKCVSSIGRVSFFLGQKEIDPPPPQGGMGPLDSHPPGPHFLDARECRSTLSTNQALPPTNAPINNHLESVLPLNEMLAAQEHSFDFITAFPCVLRFLHACHASTALSSFACLSENHHHPHVTSSTKRRVMEVIASIVLVPYQQAFQSYAAAERSHITAALASVQRNIEKWRKRVTIIMMMMMMMMRIVLNLPIGRSNEY
jgi:hypothetical protein